jgi:hypothetical protein
MKTLTENTRVPKARPVLVKTVVGLEIFGAVGGFAGGIPFLLDPSGKLLGWSTSALTSTPIHDFFLPGLWLAGVFGVGGLLVSYWLWSGRAVGRPLSYLLGVAASVWIVLESVVFGLSPVLALFQLVFCGPMIASAILLFRSKRVMV